MTHDPHSTLRPLAKVAPDVEALRVSPRASSVVRVARASETVLRRMLRDDPTAPVELRLRALSADDLGTDELLAELRRRDRLPMGLAAAFHDLSASAERLVAEGGDADARDASVALAVADGLERHVLAHRFDAPLEDPVLFAADETLIPPAPDEPDVHPVPNVSQTRPVWPWVAGALGAVVLIALVWWLAGRGGGGGGDALARGETAYRRGDTAQALAAFREAAAEDSAAPLPRFYLAQIHRQAGRADSAARQLRAGLAAAPEDPGLNVELGFLLLETGRPAEAARRFRSAVLLDSTSVRAWGGLVEALRTAGQPAQAEGVLARAPAEVRALLRRQESGVGAPPAAAPPSEMP